MFIRELPGTTLSDLQERMEKADTKQVSVYGPEVKVDLRNKEFQLTEKVSVPADPEGIMSLGDWLDIPSKFLLRVDPDVQQYLLRQLLSKSKEGVVFYTKGGVRRVVDPSIKIIDPRVLVDIASRVIDPKAPVVDHWHDNREFRLDVIVPENFDRGIGGDKSSGLKKGLGDITRGGIRIFQNVKNNLAPSVSELLWRVTCTNGMEIMDEMLKVDARGNTVEEVLAHFEAMADRAFRRVEETISHFYELRDVPVDNPERVMLRIANEQNLPSRTAFALAERAPAIEDNSMFGLLNMITNAANEPTVKAGVRRNLQRIAGTVVSEEVDRCSHCKSKLER
jgi:hypothetical protein